MGRMPIKGMNGGGYHCEQLGVSPTGQTMGTSVEHVTQRESLHLRWKGVGYLYTNFHQSLGEPENPQAKGCRC